MSARELEKLLGEWRDLTFAERESITAENWTAVHTHQNQKRELQQRIQRTTAAWRATDTDSDEAEYARHFRPMVAELVLLENANAELVKVRRTSVRAELDGFERTTEVLRGLNRAYGATAAVQWTSYS